MVMMMMMMTTTKMSLIIPLLEQLLRVHSNDVNLRQGGHVLVPFVCLSVCLYVCERD